MRGWSELSRAELDDAYANAPHIPEAEHYPRAWSLAALAFRELHAPREIAYGPHPRQRLDLFLPEAAPRGLMVFVHGGYWRAFDRTDWSHLARGALARGFAAALPGYVLAPEASLPEITAMIAVALDRVAAEVPGPIHLAGHSAGGHLVARMVMADAAPACAARLRRCVPISPVADLRPLVPQSLNADLRLTSGMAAGESPVLGQPLGHVGVTPWVGGAERPAFRWQAEALAAAWGCGLRVDGGRHHFDIIEALTNPQSALMDSLL